MKAEASTTTTARRLRALIRFLRMRRFGFTLRPDDILIGAYPRSGSTLMQMLVLQLVTDGATDFDHLLDASPWFEHAPGVEGRDLEALPFPRVLKTHLPHRLVPKGPCRYVYLVRNGRDVAVSYYHRRARYKGCDRSFPASSAGSCAAESSGAPGSGTSRAGRRTGGGSTSSTSATRTWPRIGRRRSGGSPRSPASPSNPRTSPGSSSARDSTP